MVVVGGVVQHAWRSDRMEEQEVEEAFGFVLEEEEEDVERC